MGTPPLPSDIDSLWSESEHAYEHYWRGELIGYTRAYESGRWEFMIALHKSGAAYLSRAEAVAALWAYHYNARTRWGQELRDKYADATLI